MALKEIIAILFCVQSVKAHLNPYYSYNLLPQDVLFVKLPAEDSSPREGLLEKKRNMTCGTLGIDETCLIVKSNVDYAVNFMYHSIECDNCSLIPYKRLKPHDSQEIVLKFASLGTTWKVADEKDKTICSLSNNYFGENSFYHIDVNETGCSLICDKEPDFIYYPLLIGLAVYVLLGLFWLIGNLIYRSVFFNNLFHRSSLDDLAAAFSSSSTIEDKKQKAPQQRLRSLDTVRGIDIVLMIFVNYGGGKYTFFHHARWNGLTIADVIFPWFIWMMGMSMAFSLKSQLRRVVSKRKIFFQIVKRSLKLFALGLMLNTLGPKPIDLTTIRILGVLQRFGVCYFVVATVHLFYASADDEANSGAFRDITSYGGEWLIMLSILITHILLTFLVHSPECPRGYLGPGGLHDQGIYENCTGGAAGYIDRVILGSSHLYQKPGPLPIYHTIQPYDPEGILGFLTSIFLVFLGLQAGKIILIHKEPFARIIRWMVWSVITGLSAGVLCCFSKNDGWVPVNKNLWSTSFILATASLAFALLSICFYLIDVKKFFSGAPFYQAGMNSILLYVGHELTHNMFPWKWQIPPTHMNELFLDLWGTSLWVVIAIWMHHLNVFITV